MQNKNMWFEERCSFTQGGQGMFSGRMSFDVNKVTLIDGLFVIVVKIIARCVLPPLFYSEYKNDNPQNKERGSILMSQICIIISKRS